jgi:glycosyltransferase involved in cell wall biosynthesis
MRAERNLVSVVMAMRDAAATLRLCLESLRCQDHPDWELLLVDDGSSDIGIDVALSLRDPRIRILADGQHRGLPARLNQAIDEARGHFIARLDADDICYPERLRRQLEVLQGNPNVDLVGSAAVVFRDGGVPIGLFAVHSSHDAICARPWAGFYLPHPTWMGRTNWFRSHRYNPWFLKAQDQELLLRTYGRSRFAAIAEPLLGYRQNGIALARVLRSRYYLSRAIVRSLPRYAARGLAGQAAKAVVDTIAISTGLERTLLRHRARPLSPRDAERWRNVWREVNGARNPVAG